MNTGDGSRLEEDGEVFDHELVEVLGAGLEELGKDEAGEFGHREAEPTFVDGKGGLHGLESVLISGQVEAAADVFHRELDVFLRSQTIGPLGSCRSESLEATAP